MSLQLDVSWALALFELAEVRTFFQTSSLPRKLEALTVNSWLVQHLLASAPPGSMPLSATRMQPIEPELVRQDESGHLALRESVRAQVLLQDGDPVPALAIFRSLLAHRSGDERALYHVGAALAEHNAGGDPEPDLDAAALHLQATDNVFRQVRGGGLLFGIRTALGQEREAGDWATFLRRLPCPQATVEM